MTEEQIKQKFKETYPDFMRGDEPLSPYFDIWEYGIEIATKELQEENERLAKHILELQRDKGRLADENKRISIQYAEETDETIKELEKQIEKMKCCENCKHPYWNAETEAEETICNNCVNNSNWELKK